MVRENCVECDIVTREDCEKHMEKVEGCIKEHENRLNKKDVADGKRDTEMRYQTWFLGGIFTLLLGMAIDIISGGLH